MAAASRMALRGTHRRGLAINLCHPLRPVPRALTMAATTMRRGNGAGRSNG